MRYMMIAKASKRSEAGAPPPPEVLAKMGQLIDEMTKAGKLILTGGLLPSSQGIRVTSSGGKITFTDGPFTEAKEIVAGFAIFELASNEEAKDISRRFWEINGDGEGEIRPMMERPPV